MEVYNSAKAVMQEIKVAAGGRNKIGFRSNTFLMFGEKNPVKKIRITSTFIM